ncbi:MAG: hypothetical protein JXP34_15120 [Planctomycetes bacterium]|nr:hypothetical protein [Planctomycetota bacterium]
MDLPIRSPVTAADLSPDGERLAVLSAGGLYIFPVGGDPRRAAEVRPSVISVPPGRLEGVCFGPDGIRMTAESREVYFIEDPLRGL